MTSRTLPDDAFRHPPASPDPKLRELLGWTPTDFRSPRLIAGIRDHGVFGGHVPVAGMAGDKQAALFGPLAGLAEQRRLLVAGDPRHRHGRRSPVVP